jgi:hypothetical protein
VLLLHAPEREPNFRFILVSYQLVLHAIVAYEGQLLRFGDSEGPTFIAAEYGPHAASLGQMGDQVFIRHCLST